jgi:YD repeat-containing protein
VFPQAYDNLNRLTSETTPQGSITYGYDLVDRRASMTVAGQPQVTYSYDNANRLTQIAQGTSTVGFSYDTANRRSTLTLSNGVNMSYTYDNDSRVTGITYKFNANTLGNLTYSYDSLGRRTQVGGSFAQTGLPGTVASATYDAANELTNWNGTPISYDLNGQHAQRWFQLIYLERARPSCDLERRQLAIRWLWAADEESPGHGIPF